jgi:hypothetical protein
VHPQFLPHVRSAASITIQPYLECIAILFFRNQGERKRIRRFN